MAMTAPHVGRAVAAGIWGKSTATEASASATVGRGVVGAPFAVMGAKDWVATPWLSAATVAKS